MAGITSLFSEGALVNPEIAYTEMVGATDADIFLDGLADLRSAVVRLDATGEDTAVQTFLGALHISPDSYRRMNPAQQEAYRRVIGDAIRKNHALFARAHPPVASGISRFATDAATAVVSILRKGPLDVFVAKYGLNQQQQQTLGILCGQVTKKNIPDILNGLEKLASDENFISLQKSVEATRVAVKKILDDSADKSETGSAIRKANDDVRIVRIRIRGFLDNVSKILEQKKITARGLKNLAEWIQTNPTTVTPEMALSVALTDETVVFDQIRAIPIKEEGPSEQMFEIAITVNGTPVFGWFLEDEDFVGANNTIFRRRMTKVMDSMEGRNPILIV